MGSLNMPTFDTPQPISATIEVVAGDVRLTASERATTTVAVEPTDASNDEDRKAAELTRIEYADNRLLVKTPKVRSWRARSHGGSVSVTVELPAGSDVHGDAGLADFYSDGPLGQARIKTGLGQIRLETAARLNLRTGIGDITVDRATGHAELTSGSGEVRVRELSDSAVIKNSNGDTWVGSAVGDLRLHAANGDIAIDRALASVGAKSANGDVRLGEAVRGTVVLESKLGDVEVGIPEGTAAWLDVRSTAGRVHNSLEAAQAPEQGAETVEVRARTTAGNVVIRRP
jgi:putative adhesin